MAFPTSRAVKLLSELADIDRKLMSSSFQGLTLLERQRRSAIVRELGGWALERQIAPEGSQRRADPRAPIRLGVQLIGGPHPVTLESESIAVGGISVLLQHFTPRVGDQLTLRLGPIDSMIVEVMGQVVWIDPIRQRAGLRFCDLSEANRAAVEYLVLRSLVQTARTPG